LPEFIALVARKVQKIDKEEELLDAFKSLDRKKTGKISSIELKHLV
jgi:Ca2+-binding EF-hand superfamily protein